MPSIDIHTTDGKTAGKFNLPEALFAAKLNPQLMAQAVRVYLSNQRHANAHAKGRGEVNLTTKKWFRQKGTGRARHGAQSASIFVGGGKAHGPDGHQNFQLKLTQNMKRAALASALTTKLQANQIIVVDGLDQLAAKTKVAAQTLTNLKLDKNRVTLIMPQKVESTIRAFRNLAKTQLEMANQLNTYTILNSDILVFTKSAIEQLTNTFTKPTQITKPAITVQLKTKSTPTDTTKSIKQTLKKTAASVKPVSKPAKTTAKTSVKATVKAARKIAEKPAGKKTTTTKNKRP